MEEAMPARRTRQEARQRIMQVFQAEVDRMIPVDESVPLKGRKFLDWEKQIARVRHSLLPVMLEERAGLENNACVEDGGHCPFCQSDSVYLEKQTTRTEVISPDGPAVIDKQHCRCRTCGGSFSPSEPGLGVACRGAADTQGGGAVEPGTGGAIG
jgi:hypothetical protein